MKYERGEALIAHFPHADGSGSKPRPVLVVQADVYNAKLHNLVVAEITGNLAHASDPASLLIDVRTPDGKATGLNRNSVISCVNLMTILERRVAKRIGQVTAAMMKQVEDCLKAALSLP